MPFENLILEKRGRVAVLTVNRPEKLNALNVATRREILDAFEQLRGDSEIRVVVITGAGDKAFINGADISEFAGRTALQQREIMRSTRAFDVMEDFPKPVIAMINGYALGGGCELAMACDFRVGSEKARLGQPEINLGIFPGGGATQRLQRLVGIGRAKELIFTGDIIDAREAERIGLLNKVFPADELMDRTMEIARKIGSKGPLALKMAKMAMNMGMETGLAVGLGYERLARTLVHGSEDRVEGMNAFIEKRKPQFKGR